MLRWSESKVLMPPLRTPNLQAKVAPAVARGAVLLLKKIQELIEPHNKSGDLIESWRVAAEGMGAVVYSDDPASVYLDKGTRAHKIQPKAGRSGSRLESLKGLRGKKRKEAQRRNFLHAAALRFEVNAEFDPLSGEMFGEEIFRPEVDHPGTTGIFYIARAEVEILPQIESMIALAVQEAILEAMPFEGAVVSPRTGRAYYGRRGAGGRFIARSR